MIPSDGHSHFMDGGALIVVLGVLMNFLPAVASILSVVWFAIRVAETRTVQQMLGKRAWIKEFKDNDD